MLNLSPITISLKNRIMLMSIFVLIILALYVTYTITGGNLIEGVQGRYFIPPALLL